MQKDRDREGEIESYITVVQVHAWQHDLHIHGVCSINEFQTYTETDAHAAQQGAADRLTRLSLCSTGLSWKHSGNLRTEEEDEP